MSIDDYVSRSGSSISVTETIAGFRQAERYFDQIEESYSRKDLEQKKQILRRKSVKQSKHYKGK